MAPALFFFHGPCAWAWLSFLNLWVQDFLKKTLNVFGHYMFFCYFFNFGNSIYMFTNSLVILYLTDHFF